MAQALQEYNNWEKEVSKKGVNMDSWDHVGVLLGRNTLAYWSLSANNKIMIKQPWLLAHLILDTCSFLFLFCLCYLLPKDKTDLTRSLIRLRSSGSVTFATTSETPPSTQSPVLLVPTPDPEALALLWVLVLHPVKPGPLEGQALCACPGIPRP